MLMTIQLFLSGEV